MVGERNSLAEHIFLIRLTLREPSRVKIATEGDP